MKYRGVLRTGGVEKRKEVMRITEFTSFIQVLLTQHMRLL